MYALFMVRLQMPGPGIPSAGTGLRRVMAVPVSTGCVGFELGISRPGSLDVVSEPV
jgi:hypothetical protein